MHMIFLGSSLTPGIKLKFVQIKKDMITLINCGILFRALDIKLRAYGDSHFDIAIAYTNLANLEADVKNFDKSLEYNLLALKVYEVRKILYCTVNHIRLA